MTTFERQHGRWAAVWARYWIYITIIAVLAEIVANGQP